MNSFVISESLFCSVNLHCQRGTPGSLRNLLQGEYSKARTTLTVGTEKRVPPLPPLNGKGGITLANVN